MYVREVDQPERRLLMCRAGKEDRILYGFVDHDVTTTYLGSTTGLRLRHVQPTGHYGCTGKTADLGTSAWVGGAVEELVITHLGFWLGCLPIPRLGLGCGIVCTAQVERLQDPQ